MLKKILKITLYIIIIGAMTALVTWVTWREKWPWWVGLCILLGIFGIWVGVIFLKKYLLRRREKQFVRRVVELDEAAIRTSPLHERQQLQDLQQHWKESVEMLRESYLRKRGNPLYVLPWYMVIGESGSGKTSAIKNTRLNSPIADVTRTAAITATRNCDWWFFEEAVILDTAGRYTIPIDEGPDKEEWEKFLVLLAKYRRREPINGVIITMPADQLTDPDHVKLREDGQSIRKRIDQLMRTVGAKFPIYVLVTKMDKVHGFVEFSSHLPEEDSSQAMGYINEGLNPHWQEVLTTSFERIGDHLRSLRLIFIHKLKNLKPGVLIFPNEFAGLEPGLQEFVKAVFDENPYQETPLFRGIYFSSARQDGEPISDFLKLVGFTPGASSEAKADKGVFLKDLFSGILPADRNLFSPIKEFLRWRRLTASLGLMSWLLVWIFLCGIMTFSFFHNLTTIKDFIAEFKEPPALKQDATTDLWTLERMRIEIMDIESDNKRWFLPWFGFDSSRHVEAELKKRYVNLLGRGFLRPFELSLYKKMEHVNRDTSQDVMADYVGYSVAQLRLLTSFLKTGKIANAEEFNKVSASLMKTEYPNVPPEISSLFGNLYCSYVMWNEDRTKIRTGVELFQKGLINLLGKGEDFRWLVRKGIPDAPDVQLRDFWGAAESIPSDSDTAMVSGAYTKLGRKHIEEFIKTVEEALTDKSLIEHKKKNFWIWYEDRYDEAWETFARRFHEGTDGLESDVAWKNMASLMTTGHSPYFRVIERMADELARPDKIGKDGKIVKSVKKPPWMAVIFELNEIQKTAKEDAGKQSKEKATVIDKITGKEKQIVQEIKGGIDPQEAKKMEKRHAIAKVWTEYLKAMELLVPVAVSRETGFRMVSEYFTSLTATAESKSPFAQAYGNYMVIKSMLSDMGDAQVAWDLLVGPLDFMLYYSVEEAACYLQEQWEGQILGKISGAAPEMLPAILFDKTEGLVWKFVNQTAKPFIGESRTGYYSRKAFERSDFEQSVPFTEEFFAFLNTGVKGVIGRQPKYDVKIETIPMETNEGARIKPYASILSLQCADGKTIIKNYNYRQKKVFRWKPDQCGDVELQILLPDLTLTVTYSGQMGFVNFLNDFRSGSRTFVSNDFPDAREKLAKMGITSLRIRYVITGFEPVLKTLDRVPSRVPSEIVTCWSN